MKERIGELEREIALRVSELNGLRDEASDQKNKSLVGKCYKYRNSYSLPTTDADYWWLYTKVTATSDGSLEGIQFQRDSNGKVEMEADVYIHLWSDGYIEISDMEFSLAWDATMNSIAAMYEAP